MTKSIGFGTAVFHEEGNFWESAESIQDSVDDVLDNARELIAESGITEKAFNMLPTLFITKVTKVCELTWEDVKPND